MKYVFVAMWFPLILDIQLKRFILFKWNVVCTTFANEHFINFIIMLFQINYFGNMLFRAGKEATCIIITN